MMRMLLRLPQPSKALYVLTLLVFLTGILTAAITQDPSWPRYLLTAAGALLVATGLVLATDFRQNATKLSSLVKASRPWGVDYSRSLMSSPGYARFLGAGTALIGAFWIVLTVFDL